jgi:hypothetical protein
MAFGRFKTKLRMVFGRNVQQERRRMEDDGGNGFIFHRLPNLHKPFALSGLFGVDIRPNFAIQCAPVGAWCEALCVRIPFASFKT